MPDDPTPDPSPAPAGGERHYAVFISYRHADNKQPGRQWASWLHQSLETYEVPADLVGTANTRGDKIPASLYPVFRDEEELPANADLTANIRTALRHSRLLVVICSPRAVESRFVAEEIRYFKEVGKADRILALMIDGEPNASDDAGKQRAGIPADAECFPGPLRFGVPGADGTVDWNARTEPIAADVRPDNGRAEGWTTSAAYRATLEAADETALTPLAPRELTEKVRAYEQQLELAKLKVIAGALAVPLGVLTQRDKAHQLARARARASALRRWLAAVGVLGVLAAAAAGFAWWQRGLAERRRAEAEQAHAQETAARKQAESARAAAVKAEGEAESARNTAVGAERRTRLGASKADTDIALELASRGEAAEAFALVVRALELNAENPIAAVLAHRLLTDGRLLVPEHLFAFDGAAAALAFSRDGRHLAVGCNDGSALVADLVTGQEFRLPKPLAGPVHKAVFSPDGESLALASGDRVVRWNFASSAEPTVVAENFTAFDVLDLVWPRADRIVVHSGRDWGSGDRLTQVLEPAGADWKILFAVGDELALNDVKFAPEVRRRMVELGWFEATVADRSGTLVVYDHDKHRISWLGLDAPDLKKPLYSADVAKEMDGAFASETGLALVGNWVAGVGKAGVAPTLEWIDPKSRERHAIPVERDWVFERVSADGERILFTTDNGTALVDRRSGKLLLEQSWKAQGGTQLLALDRGGTSWLRVPREAARRSTVLVANVIREKALRESALSLPAAAIYRPLAYSLSREGAARYDDTGRWLAVASADNRVRVWSRAAMDQPALSLRALPDKPAASAPYELETGEIGDDAVPGTIFRRDPQTGQRVKVADLQPPEEVSQPITGHDFSPDGRRVAVSYGSQSDRPDNDSPSVAVVYDTSNGRPVGTPVHHDDDVFSPCFGPDGAWFVTASDDRTIRRWNTETGAPLGEPIRLPSRVRFAKVSPRGDLLVTGNGYLIDVAGWRVVRPLTPDPGRIARAFFSPDGLWLATVSDSYGKEGDGEEIDYTALNQWELGTGFRIAEPIETPQKTDFRWGKPGQNLLSGELDWQCVFPCPVPTILPLLQACRPLYFGAAGDRASNPQCSRRQLKAGQFFPAGRTDQNAGVYDFAQRVLQPAPTVHR